MAKYADEEETEEEDEELTAEELVALEEEEERKSRRLPPVKKKVARPEPVAVGRNRTPSNDEWEYVYQQEMAGYKKGGEFLPSPKAIEKILNLLEEINLKI